MGMNQCLTPAPLCPTVLACLTAQPDGTNAVPNVSRFYDKATGTWQLYDPCLCPPVTVAVATNKPTAAPANLNVRNFATTPLGETWEWINGAWSVVRDIYEHSAITTAGSVAMGSAHTFYSHVAPRDGKIDITGLVRIDFSAYGQNNEAQILPSVNGVYLLNKYAGPGASSTISPDFTFPSITVAAGDIVAVSVFINPITGNNPATVIASALRKTVLRYIK